MTESKALAKLKTASDEKAMRRVMNRIADGSSVRDACKRERMSRRSFLRAAASNPKWRDELSASTVMRAHALADSLIGIASGVDTSKRLAAEMAEALRDLPPNKAEAVAKALVNASVQRDRLLVDTLKWTAAKLLPTQYGPAMTVQSVASETPTVRVVFEPLPPWASEGEPKSLPVPEAEWEVLNDQP